MAFSDLKHNSQKYTPDIIIATYPTAVDFVSKTLLFPKVPKIFIMPPNVDISKIPNSICIPFANDFKGNIEHCLKLVPTTKKFYIISGSGALDNVIANKFKHDINGLPNNVSFYFSTNLTTRDILSDVKYLPYDSLIYYLSYTKDPVGKVVDAHDFCKQVAEKANRPVFTASDFFVSNTGVLGGRVTSSNYLASSLVDTITKLGIQEDLKSINNETPCFQYIYNCEEIDKWGIDYKKLPSNAILQNKSYSFLKLCRLNFEEELKRAYDTLHNFYMRRFSPVNF